MDRFATAAFDTGTATAPRGWGLIRRAVVTRGGLAFARSRVEGWLGVGFVAVLLVGGSSSLLAAEAPPLPQPPAPVAVSPEAVFDQAAKLYEGGRAQEAALVYGRLLTNGVTTPAVLFNQGNAWLRAGKVGQAIAAYRRAQSLSPRDPDVASNLERARAKVGAGATQVEGIGARALGWLTPNEWAGLALAGLWLWLGGLTLGRLSARLKPVIATSSWPLALFAMLMLGIAGAAGWRAGRAAAVVIVPDVSVRFGPLEESQVAFTLPDGAELVITDRKGDWMGVRDAAGRRGWIAGRNVVTIP